MDALDAEIKVLEKASFGNHTEEKVSAKSEEQETIVEEVPESTEGVIVQEPTDTVETQTMAEEVPKKQRTDWKGRYKKYKASTDTTIYSLRQENVSLSEQNLKLSEQVDELSLKLSEVPEEIIDPLTAEEKEILGTDAVDSLQKLVDAKVKATVEPLEQQLVEEKNLRKIAKKESLKASKEANESSFLERLEEVVPDCREIDSNPEFLKWMGEVEPESGFSREYIFRNSQSIGDVKRVSEFFTTWKGLQEAGNTVLDEHISPTQQVSASQPNKQKAPELVPYAEISKFYTDASRPNGPWKGREREMQELKKKYDLALSQRGVRF
jgi:hypothetical protein